jgi:hypothetical protein
MEGKEMEEQQLKPTANFDRAREMVWGAPGFLHKQATINSPGSAFIPSGSWIVESVKTDDQSMIFLQYVGAEGATRLVLPAKVVDTIYRQHKDFVRKSKSNRAKKSIETRQKRGDRFFEKKGAANA